MISGRDTATRVDYSEPSLAQARDTPNLDSPDPSHVNSLLTMLQKSVTFLDFRLSRGSVATYGR